MARLDSELVARGIARSRERAKEMIAAGNVTVNGMTAKKASDNVNENDDIRSCEQEKYVGRGALKLEKAAEEFGLDLTGKVCLDIGASTGGFTDLMLKNGASHVFAVDVGHGRVFCVFHSYICPYDGFPTFVYDGCAYLHGVAGVLCQRHGSVAVGHDGCAVGVCCAAEQ